MFARAANGAVAAPITLNQERRLLFESVARAQQQRFLSFNQTFGVEIDGRLDDAALAAALQAVVQRHGALRAAFRTVERVAKADRVARTDHFLKTGVLNPGLYEQWVWPEARLRLERFPGFTVAEVEQAIQREWPRPFDYDRPPLLRALLFGLGAERHLLMLITSHLICDRLSLEILFRDLQQCYRHIVDGTTVPAPAGTSYETALQRLVDHFDRRRTSHALAHWQQEWSRYGDTQLRPADFSFALPLGRRPGLGFGREEIALDDALVQRLKVFASRARVTLYMVFLAAFALVLRHCTGHDRLTLWGNFDTRAVPETEAVMGWLVHTHMLGIDLGEGTTGTALLRHVRRVVMAALEHRGLPLVELWRHTGSIPASEMRICFDLFNVPDETPACARELRMRAARLPVQVGRCSDFELLAFVRPSGIRLVARYQHYLFTAVAVRQLLERCVAEVERLLDGPDEPLVPVG
jgi:hypothetical protein